jgi:hypothetical protein
LLAFRPRSIPTGRNLARTVSALLMRARKISPDHEASIDHAGVIATEQFE